MNQRFPITSLGLGAIVGFAGCYAIGWWLGWIEFIAVAAGFLVALLIGLPFVVGGQQLKIDREIAPKRVSVGGQATSVLTIGNAGRRPSAPRIVEDRIAGRQSSLDIPALAPGAQTQAVASLPTGKRAVVRVGPALITRADPLGLFRRDLGQTGVQELWVHPRFAALPSMRSGLVKDLEGPTYDSSPAGDVAFHAIREYSVGDDIRHIHWMSTARTGTLMVRHFVDNRRPYLGVLVDTDASSLFEDGFEIALEIAASLIVSAFHDSRPIALWVGEQEVVTTTTPGDEIVALDRFCVSRQSQSDRAVEDMYQLIRLTDPGVSAFVFITGEKEATELLPITSAARRHGQVIVIRVVSEGAEPIAMPNARVLDCTSLDQFSHVWQRVAA